MHFLHHSAARATLLYKFKYRYDIEVFSKPEQIQVIGVFMSSQQKSHG